MKLILISVSYTHLILVDKQGSTSHYIFLLFHNYLRRHSRKVIGYKCCLLYTSTTINTDIFRNVDRT